jgi:hypothetical protein
MGASRRWDSHKLWRRTTIAKGDIFMSVHTESPNRVWKAPHAAVLTNGVLSSITWYRHPISSHPISQVEQAEYSLLSHYLPKAEFTGEVSVDIRAPAGVIFDALQSVTLDDMPLAKWLGNLRYLPGRRLAKTPAVEAEKAIPFLELIQSQGGNIILDEEPERELIFGAIGKFHNMLDQQVAALQSPKDFIDFAHPDYQKLAMSFRVIPFADQSGCRLTLTHCTHSLSRTARWKFALYWLLVKPGGNFVSWLLLRAVKSIAEKVTVEVASKNSRLSLNRRVL